MINHRDQQNGSSLSNLTVIIPWADRPEIHECLIRNRELLARTQAVIIANAGGSKNQIHKLAIRAGLPSLSVLHIPMIQFNKACAINLAVSRTHAKKIIVLDNDILIGQRTLAALAACATKTTFSTAKRMCDRNDEAVKSDEGTVTHLMRIKPRRRDELEIETSQQSIGSTGRSAPGIACFTRAAFLAVGGMNSKLYGWGWEDIDLIVRLQLALRLQRRQTGTVGHLDSSIGSAKSGFSKKASSQTMNFQTALAAYMVGELSGTYGEDLARWKMQMSLTRYAG